VGMVNGPTTCTVVEIEAARHDRFVSWLQRWRQRDRPETQPLRQLAPSSSLCTEFRLSSSSRPDVRACRQRSDNALPCAGSRCTASPKGVPRALTAIGLPQFVQIPYVPSSIVSGAWMSREHAPICLRAC